MSCGLVICSTCKRELQQDGPREIERGWRHLDDGTPRCVDAQAQYPALDDVGRFRCEEHISGMGRCTRMAQRRVVHERFLGDSGWVCEEHIAPPPKRGRRVGDMPIVSATPTRGGTSGVKDPYSLCACGSGKKRKWCCR